MSEFRDITAPVGGYTGAMQQKGIANLPADLKTVSALMEAIPARTRGFDRVPSAYAGWHAFVPAIESFQEMQFGISCGRMEPGNVTIAALNRLAAQHGGGDPVDIAGPVTFPKEMMIRMQAQSVQKLRNGIVKKAAMHIGQVNSGGGGYGVGGQKAGAELLWQIHAETMQPVPSYARNDVMASEKKPWSWCGIYGLWCVIHGLKEIGSAVPLHWSAGIGIFRAGLKIEPRSIREVEQLGKGDICVVDEESKGVWLNHHVIVAEDHAGKNFRTIEGNYWDKVKRVNQSIVHHERKVGEVLQVYRVGQFLDPVVM